MTVKKCGKIYKTNSSEGNKYKYRVSTKAEDTGKLYTIDLCYDCLSELENFVHGSNSPLSDDVCEAHSKACCCENDPHVEAYASPDASDDVTEMF